MKFVRREDYGLPADSPAAFIGSTKGTTVHYLGERYESRAHSGCDDKVRQVRLAHLNHPTEDYVDIAYNMIACEHGYSFEGRGAHRRSGANGTAQLNTDRYSVLALLGSSGMVRPSDPMLHALRDCIGYLRTQGSAGASINGHRDGTATLCPGAPLYAWVQAGAPRPGTGADMTITNDDVVKILTTDGIVPNGNPDTKESNPFITLAQSVSFTETVARRTDERVRVLYDERYERAQAPFPANWPVDDRQRLIDDIATAVVAKLNAP